MKRTLRHVVAASLLFVLTGCIGTSSQVRSAYAPAAGDKFAYAIENAGGMSAEGLQILDDKLKSELSTGGLLAAASDPAARKVEIRITNYRMRHGAARAMAGIMAGKDNITSDVRILERGTGKLLGQLTVESGNATAVGTSRGLIEGHAREIVEFLRGSSR
jgi:hypothetical protein